MALDIKYIKHQDLDYKQWDNCIANAFNGIVYGYSWYLDIVCDSWDALVEGDYEIVMPLTHRVKYGIHYLYQPFFTQQLGLFSIKKLDATTTESFIKAIPSKYRYAEINLNIFNKLEKKEWIGRRNITYELDLIKHYDKLHKAYSTNTKRNIKKAQEHKINVVKGSKPEVLINMFKADKGRDLKKLQDDDYNRLQKIMTFSMSHNIGQIYFAHNDKNEVCAGAFFITANQKSIFLFSASNKDGKENSAMFAIIDSFIKVNAERNLTLDFEGSNIEGLARFYSSFGAKECEYLTLKINKLPLYLKIFKR
ncbi:MAG: hypothetical protein A2275_09905 [Bacteroidetes bacterium RIFOXYA12_FULL_35_11]|nr:MAG: hypothetical protein A2X01_03670 [Bacteroidetes bacterium GWF2_35_48]OFY82314.1 MAG: hypothetical protein A2275_09905 [Bacteroidetes bacterium RIFOXYA12_FULL_35_11]OFY96280.1 MAG: hypothetical protein A2491_06810 [Bacteroidetes bacterium RIFOXYC12_FULL_35_7]OFY97485.1 MAG: hypothetical protein A2309_06880 [Bacteroidetes bacterium RIFOXYB2_FULL_35_7]HBX51029.1 hypothetical protein [Bacteroidales bacterium]